MSDPNKPPSLDDLGDRISKVRREAGLEEPEGADADRTAGSGLGMAWRISIEIVVAVVVCTAIGWGLDTWLGTTPWLMLLLLVLGAAAGMNNAVRTVLRMDAEAAEAARRGPDEAAGKGERGKQGGG